MVLELNPLGYHKTLRSEIKALILYVCERIITKLLNKKKTLPTVEPFYLFFKKKLLNYCREGCVLKVL